MYGIMPHTSKGGLDAFGTPRYYDGNRSIAPMATVLDAACLQQIQPITTL